MDNGAVGFLLGAVPGAFLVLRNMWRQVRAVAEAQKIAQAKGEYLDYHWNYVEQNDLAFKPDRFIKPGDGPGVREAKEMLLARRDKFFASHIKGGAVMMGGCLVGAFIGAAAGSLVQSWR
jgi:hypothetical protein